MWAWFLLGQLLRVGVRGRGGYIVPCAVAKLSLSPGTLGGQSLSHRIGGVEQDPCPRQADAAVSLFKVLHSCWAVIRGEACLSLIIAPLALQTAGRQTAR